MLRKLGKRVHIPRPRHAYAQHIVRKAQRQPCGLRVQKTAKTECNEPSRRLAHGLEPSACTRLAPTIARMRIRVATFNLQAGVGSHAPQHLWAHGWRYLLPHPEQAHVLARAARFLAPYAIVGVQEADAGGMRTGGCDQLARLAELAGFPYRAAMTTRRIGKLAKITLGLLTRFPVLACTRHRLPGSRHGRGALRVVLDVHGEHWCVIVTHLSLSRRARRLQVAALAELVAPQRTLLLGDLNCTPHSPEFRLLHQLTGLVPPASGAVATWPSWSPVRAIDHVLATPDLSIEGVCAVPTGASDHCLLAATITSAARQAA